MFANFAKAVRSLISGSSKRKVPARRKDAWLSLEMLERRDMPSAVQGFDHISSNALPQQFVAHAGSSDAQKYYSFTPGSEGLMDWAAEAHEAPQGKHFGYELYLSPDSSFDTKDRLLLSGPVEYGSSSSGVGKDTIYFVNYGGPFWNSFRMPDAADAIYKQADRSVDGGDRHAQVWTSLRIVNRDSGESWWGGQQFHDVILGKVADEKPDIRINSAVVNNDTLTLNVTLTGRITTFQVGLFVANDGFINPVRFWTLNCTNGGSEGTFDFTAKIGPNGAHLPGAGADPSRQDDYSIFAVADPDSKIAESDETNNRAAMTGWYLNGNNVFVQGGAGADSVKIAADDANKQVFFSVNGAGYHARFNAGMSFNVRGHGGDDSVDVNFGNGSQRIVVSSFGGDGRNKMRVSGSAGKDTADIYADPRKRSSFVGPNYGIWFSDVADIEVTGGGGTDTVYLYDSQFDDRLTFRPGDTTMKDLGNHYTIRALNFSSVYAGTFLGGVDWAELYGSNNLKNTFIAGREQATLFFGNQSVDVSDFANVRAFGNPGGSDTAKLSGSDTYDELTVKSDEVEMQSMTGVHFTISGKGFRNVEAFSGGGNDLATINCQGNDTFVAYPDRAIISGQNFSHTLWGFKQVTALAASKGNDTATFNGTSANDAFTADPTHAMMTADGVYKNQAVGFHTVRAVAGGGGKIAELTGSGGRDLLKASSIDANLTGVDHGANYSIFVKGFRDVEVDGKSNAQAYLYDSTGNDILGIAGTGAYLFDNPRSYSILVKNFSRLDAISQKGGADSIIYSGAAIPVKTMGPWTDLNNASAADAGKTLWNYSWPQLIALLDNLSADRVAQILWTYSWPQLIATLDHMTPTRAAEVICKYSDKDMKDTLKNMTPDRMTAEHKRAILQALGM